MKQVKIYFREVTERTGYRKYPFKSVKQIYVDHGDDHYSNTYETPFNPSLKKPFKVVFCSGSKKVVTYYRDEVLGRDNASKWLKDVLTKILNEDNDK